MNNPILPDAARDGRFPSLAHWGAFTAIVEAGRFVRCEPFVHDQAPSPMLAAMPAMVYSPLRVARPAVRAGWLARREMSDRAQRGLIECRVCRLDDGVHALAPLRIRLADHGAHCNCGMGEEGIFH